MVVLVGLSALWAGRETLLLMALMPLCALAFAVLPEIGYRLFDMNGVDPAASASIALTVLGGGVVVGVLTRRAHHRATTLAQS